MTLLPAALLITYLALLMHVVVVVVVVHGHVALLYPPGRTTNDYLYTFDGTCVQDSCDAYCGDPIDTPGASVTILPVDTPFNIRWYSPIPHEPYQYRLSLNRQSYDGNFDSNDSILTIVNANDARIITTGSTGYNNNNNNFETTVTISSDALPSCADMNSPCVLQLFDLYYFVSCANVVFTNDINDVTVDPDLLVVDSDAATSSSYFDYEQALQDVDYYDPSSLIIVTSASFDDYKITLPPPLPPPSAARGDDQGLLLDPTLELRKCVTYTFAMNSPGHPFVLQTTRGIIIDNYDDENGTNKALYDYQPYPIVVVTKQNSGDDTNEIAVVDVNVDGIEQGIYQFTVPIDAPTTLYYQCTLHENMSGTINIIDLDLDNGIDGASFNSCEEYFLSIDANSSSSASSSSSFNYGAVSTSRIILTSSTIAVTLLVVVVVPLL